MKSNDIHIRAISQEMPQPPITKICLKITYLISHLNFPGANELTQSCPLIPLNTVTYFIALFEWWWFDLSALWNQGHGSAPDSKVHGANMGPIWGREDPGGPHVGPLNFAIWGIVC